MDYLVAPALEPRAYPIKLPDAFQRAVDHSRAQKPELFELRENELWDLLEAEDKIPDATIGMMRLRFWDEWKRAEGRTMVLVNIMKGVCTEQQLNNAVRDPYKLAWILSPPSALIARYEEAVDLLVRNLRKVCLLPVVDPRTGKKDIPLARFQFSVLQYFDQRLHGAITQKVEMKSTSVNANVTAKATDEQIDKLLENLPEEELMKVLTDMRNKQIIDVTPQ